MIPLQNNLFTDTGWEIIENQFDHEQLITTGSNFMIGNGFLGYRGTFAEWERDRYVACIVTDTWDFAENRAELCNVPNGLFTRLYVQGEMFSAFVGETLNYRRELSLRHGIYRRQHAWRGTHGKAVIVDIEKFASEDNVHLTAMRYTITAQDAVDCVVETGIDGRLWSMNGEHFKSYNATEDHDLLSMQTITQEHGITIEVVERLTVHATESIPTEIVHENKRILRKLTFSLNAGESITLEKRFVIVHSNNTDTPYEQATRIARDKADYDTLKQAHIAKWETLWAVSDIVIAGNLEDQLITRFNLFHNIIGTPRHTPLPIGARGLSCQVYQGAAFWDQEIFNLPMFIYTQPQIARNVLNYRYETLDGARRKARRLGYYGAFYAWTSGKTGDELFPDYFFTDVNTGRKVHNHFNSWQIHVSQDVVYAIRQYYEATDDWDFILNGGAEIAFEVAQFIVSRVHLKMDKNRYEIIRLLGPDEYHENVDNNAFTMYQTRFALQTALEFYERMKKDNPEALSRLMQTISLDETNIATWRDIHDRIYLPLPNRNAVIEQFDGYFQLEDITPAALHKRLIHPEEYWGWPNGIAIETQVLKQADVVQLLAIHDDFSPEVIRANFDYYEPRTEHGSSLSPSVHAQVAVPAGYPDRAYAYFKEAATIDLYNESRKVFSGGTFLGGIHTAACGGIWVTIIRAFAGLRVVHGEVTLKPNLPASWDQIKFHIMVYDNLLDVTMNNNTVTVQSHLNNDTHTTITIDDETLLVEPGSGVSFTV